MLCLFVSMMKQERPVLFVNSELVDIGEQLRLGLEAKAFNLADQALLARRLEIADIFNAQCLMEREDLFEIQTRNFAQLRSPGAA